MSKVHNIMRDLPKYCATPTGRKHILDITKEVEPLLPILEQFADPDQQIPLSRAEIDVKWKSRYKEPITRNLKKAAAEHDRQRESETPIGLLDAALKKLKHPQMDLTAISANDYEKARTLTVKIQNRAKVLEKSLYTQKRKARKLTARE